MGKKQQVIEQLFLQCLNNNNFEFDNTLVKKISAEVGFGNPFDVTKVDNTSNLPKTLTEKDYAIIHLGKGKHKFIKGIDKVYHNFEPIDEHIDWKYKRSILNKYNSSESNILSIANNQRILHHFLFGKDTELCDTDIINRPKTYFPHRTKSSLTYSIGEEKVNLDKIQIEIDLTIEYQGVVGVFEAKNGKPDNFAIYQIYHPFLYYHNAKELNSITKNIKKIKCVYVVRRVESGIDYISLWAYTFEKPLDITSIKFIKSAEYKLIEKED